MRILFITNVPSPYRVDFFNELGRLCDLTVLFDRKTVDYRKEEWLAFVPETFTPIFLKGIEIKNSKISLEIIKYLDKSKYDIIIVGGYSTYTGMIAIQYMKIKKIPFILSFDGGMIKNEKNITNKIKKYFISSASAWLSTGQMTTDYLQYYGAREEKIYTYPFTSIKNEDILEQIMSKTEKKHLKDSLHMEEDVVILSVGQFIPRKGYDILMRSMNKVKNNTGLYIVGGEPTEEYIKLKEELGLNNIHFVNFKDKHELKQYYMAADIFVLPTRIDIWGLVINEAMANGLPIITTNRCVAGLELVSDYENGFIIPVNNIDELSEKINYVLENDIEKMSINSLKMIKKHTIENMAKIHLDVVNDFIKELGDE